MDIKPAWIIASLLIMVFGNIIIYGVVQQDISLAASQSQSLVQSASGATASIGSVTSVFDIIKNALMWDYPSIFNGAWVWARYILLCVDLPIMIGMMILILRILSSLMFNLTSFIKW